MEYYNILYGRVIVMQNQMQNQILSKKGNNKSNLDNSTPKSSHGLHPINYKLPTNTKSKKNISPKILHNVTFSVTYF